MLWTWLLIRPALQSRLNIGPRKFYFHTFGTPGVDIRSGHPHQCSQIKWFQTRQGPIRSQQTLRSFWQCLGRLLHPSHGIIGLNHVRPRKTIERRRYLSELRRCRLSHNQRSLPCQEKKQCDKWDAMGRIMSKIPTHGCYITNTLLLLRLANSRRGWSLVFWCARALSANIYMLQYFSSGSVCMQGNRKPMMDLLSHPEVNVCHNFGAATDHSRANR